MNKKLMGIIVIIVAAVIVVGVVKGMPKSGDKGPTISEGNVSYESKPVEIAAKLALSGDKAPWGLAARNGAKLAVEEINANKGIRGNPVILIEQDTMSKEANAFSTDALTVLPDTDAVGKNVVSTWYGVAPAGYAPRSPEKSFVDTYKKAFGEAPAYGASNAYDAVYVLARVATEQPKDLARYMQSTNFRTVSFGKITFDENGKVYTPESYFVKK